MLKPDVAVTISAADRLLETTTNPLHRQILENYRRHAILEVCGYWEDIFLPSMTVEEPMYYFNVRGFPGNKAEGAEAVQKIYKHLAESSGAVMVVEDERLMVSDWGFASEALFNTYYRGHTLIEDGIEVDSPEGYYILKQRYVLLWPYDDRGRLMGEHLYEDKTSLEIEEVSPEEAITPARVREIHRELLGRLEAERGERFWVLDVIAA